MTKVNSTIPKLRYLLAGLASTSFGTAAPAIAEPTQVTVRVISRDAKFVGDGTGGARVTLREAASGRVLASGTTTGGTGSTDLIMNSAGRSPLRANTEAAAFNAILDIESPTLVVLEAEGPLGRPGSRIKVAAQRWMMPGVPVTAGDGWVVELPGLAITPAVSRENGKIRVTAKVEPMCGCPITAGGMWDAADYRVTASLWKGHRRQSQTDLVFARAPGGYEG
ncbi:hypothetical protein HGI47_15020, partial [Novosphingobium sp. ERN07]|uniref:hypothetical protein n=1 Tax=Novosphingobium sp. ERN07 TaxID=2726187 RepID=UPI0014565740